MLRCNVEVNSHYQQVILVKTLFLIILFLISVECSDNKLIEKRNVHRIVIIPDRNDNNKKRPTKGSSYTHYFNSPEQQVQAMHFTNGVNQMTYHNKMKLPSKNRYEEIQLPDSFFKDESAIHVLNSKNGWKPVPGISHNQQQQQQQHFLHSSNYNNLSPGSSSSSAKKVPPLHSSSRTTTSKKPSNSSRKTNKKINRTKNRFSTTGEPRHKSLAEIIDITTKFPQPLPPVQTYLNIMTDLYETSDQSQDYLYQNVLVRPRLKKLTMSSTTTHIPKTMKKFKNFTTNKPYEVYENIDEDFPSPVVTSGRGSSTKVPNYGKRIRARRPSTRSKTTSKK